LIGLLGHGAWAMAGAGSMAAAPTAKRLRRKIMDASLGA
jgi:hypothetical protein